MSLILFVAIEFNKKKFMTKKNFLKKVIKFKFITSVKIVDCKLHRHCL